MPQESLPRPTAEDAQALVTLIESEPAANRAARELAATLRITPEVLEAQFMADASYLFQTYSLKVSAAQRHGLSLRGEDELSRLQHQGQDMLRLMAASDARWHYQAFTDRNITKLVACLAVIKRDAHLAFG
ncbi:MAG: hypothetical protein M3046_00370 [Actinomycetota bacterium]|nr:hypothetical protein [Actinomycetota bacterium]